MSRSFASYLVGDVEISQEEADGSFLIIYLVLTLLPLSIFIISGVLSLITKMKFFRNVTKFWFEIFTYGIIERIFISTIKYLRKTDGKTSSIEVDKSRSLCRVNEKIFTKTTSKRMKISAALLFPIQIYVITLVIVDQLFILNHSTETCQTYEEKLASNPLYIKQCIIRPKSVSNTSFAEFLNPANAFGSVVEPPNVNASDLCQNQTSLQSETFFSDHIIRCSLYYFRWNNIINTLTNAIQWHQITVFIIKGILAFTFSWQSSLGHTQWWSKMPIIPRLLILILLTTLWTGALIVYVLIIIAFNKTLRSLQMILSYQTGAVLLIPIFFIPLLFYNTITLFHWLIRTIRRKKCEQEVSATYDHYRNILMYAENDEDDEKSCAL